MTIHLFSIILLQLQPNTNSVLRYSNNLVMKKPYPVSVGIFIMRHSGIIKKRLFLNNSILKTQTRLKMKQIYLTFLLCIGIVSVGFSQTNTFPTTGNAGAGTTTPVSLLELSSATGTATIVPTTLTITSTSNNSDWSTTIPWANIDFYSKDASGTGPGVRARIGVLMGQATGGTTEMAFYTNDGTSLAEKARLDYHGFFGLGTPNPATMIDVSTTSAALGIRSQSSASLSPTSGGGFLAVTPTAPDISGRRLGVFAFGAPSSGSTYRYSANISAFSSEQWSPSASGSYLTFSTNANGTNSLNEQMRIDNAGNVSIGTTNSNGYKLAVNGTEIATSMTVKAYINWPDYVFKKQYKLPALNDVKTYIDRNNHLPELPSEAQVAKDGINLGEMNKILVKKVEELTLYLIDQQNLLRQQELTIKMQKDKSRQLEKRVSRIESSLKSNH
jgi:hypothetical protein